MMFRTFTTGDGNIMIGHHQFPDFGSTLSIMQSFALGHNFPTQYPHFTGERIRYHFLFYFQAGNLEFLGLNPALANNILSIFSLTSLLILIMTLGSVLFRSRIAGRIGAALFFFHGSLAFIPFLWSMTSFADLMDKLSKMTLYLKSGFPYRGEEWGVWSQNVFLNQRHLASAIAIFVLVLIYLVMLFREHREFAVEPAEANVGDAEENEDGAVEPDDGEVPVDGVEKRPRIPSPKRLMKRSSRRMKEMSTMMSKMTTLKRTTRISRTTKKTTRIMTSTPKNRNLGPARNFAAERKMT
jgi:hypothetical protein